MSAKGNGGFGPPKPSFPGNGDSGPCLGSGESQKKISTSSGEHKGHCGGVSKRFFTHMVEEVRPSILDIDCLVFDFPAGLHRIHLNIRIKICIAAEQKLPEIWKNDAKPHNRAHA